MSDAQAVTDGNFNQEVLQAGKTVLVDFWAEWCGPCRALAPTVDEVAKENPETLKVVKMNVDENPSISSQYGIRSIPTLLVFKGGKLVEQMIGNMPKQALVSKLRPHLG